MLEDQVRASEDEAANLKTELTAVQEENQRLLTFTKLLLSSQAVKNFVAELSTDAIDAFQAGEEQSAPQQAQQQPQQPMQQPYGGDEMPQQTQLQQNTMQGMTMMTGTELDLGNNNSNNWGTGMNFNFGAQVFALTELPEPSIDLFDSSFLSGKGSDGVSSLMRSVKDDVPTIEAMPHDDVIEKTVDTCNDNVDFDESDPAYALFADTPCKSTSTSSEPKYLLFGTIAPEKAFERLNLVVNGGAADEDIAVSTATIARFESLCHGLDAAFECLASFTAHL